MSIRKVVNNSHVSARSYMQKLNGGTLTFGQMLESLRLSEEISQAEFAKKLGISKSHLCDIEKGRKNVGPSRAAHFAKILKQSPAVFLEIALEDLLKKEGLDYKLSLAANF